MSNSTSLRRVFILATAAMLMVGCGREKDDAADDSVAIAKHDVDNGEETVITPGQHSVSGVVVDVNGKPVPNAPVWYSGEGQASFYSRTDANGKFKADGIFKGKVRITAGLRGIRRWEWHGSVDTEAGATDIKIVLDKKGGPPGKGRACFPGQTGVWVDGAVVPISEVGRRRAVRHIAHVVPTVPLGHVERIEEHEGVFECRDILLDSGNGVSVVDGHCFLLDSGKWIAAQDLEDGLRLKTLDGTVGIKSVTTRATPYIGKVYNLKIANSDRYPVGKDGTIVRDY